MFELRGAENDWESEVGLDDDAIVPHKYRSGELNGLSAQTRRFREMIQTTSSEGALELKSQHPGFTSILLDLFLY